ncbi:MAG: hypothetical protein V4508_19705 [Pseudomonadota bacterium]
MFQMFGFGGVKCPRCGHAGVDSAGYCAECGLTPGAARNEPVLRENRWIPAADELAVFFGVRELSGIFVKTLRVPATTRAFILQGEKATEVPQGEYEIEGFFTRLNHLLRNDHAEILITRSSALPIEFCFDDLHTAEHLAVSARFVVSVKIEQVSAFARHFMTTPGTVSSANLRELLAPSVRQLAAEFIAGQSLRDMSANRELRPQLDERLQGALKMRLAQFGLAVAQVDTLALRHDKFDANRARIGSLWLVVDEGHVKLEHVKQLDQLYDDQEWQRIWREQQQGRLRTRRAELRQDESIERVELSLHNAERAQALRAREIDLFGRIVEAKNRKQALERGAGDVLDELDHALAKKGAAREDESTEWAHLRALAQIRMRTELEIAQQDALEAHQLAQQRFSHRLLQQQIENKIAQALGIEDEGRKRAELARLHQAAQEEVQRAQAIDAGQHQAALQALALADAAHRRGAEREQEWEDQLALERQRALLRADALKDAGARADLEQVNQAIETLRRSGAQADAIGQHEKLLRTIEADGQHTRQQQQVQLEGDAQRHAMKQREQEAHWQQELRRLEHERESRFAQLAHAADMGRIETARAEAIGALSDTAKVALAAAPNAQALADVLKTQLHAGMSAQQLQALSGVVAASNSVTPGEAARVAQERALHERALRDADLDKDRRHQLDLLNLQNEVNKAALAAQSQLGVGVAQGRVAGPPRLCANGHALAAADQFCARCGAPAPT